ncbi:hypothetical protein K144316041_p21400 (plasmid) [Clostridium tetani]|uniref:hypothetical protein n=1 Tax=Clostridium tetani TaxID=1513 RepID=UPI0029536EB0|nr:hypothetical protein [Clostridium tetani]BDR74301.1 hypothetical protein K144316041_p21400 [Clostridium tetani]
MENKCKKDLEKIINYYQELEESASRQLLEIVSTESIKPIERKRIIKKIILGERYGQDLTEKEILKNLNDKEKIRYLLNRLFIEDIEIGAEIKFIEKVKNGKIKIDKFLDLHKKQPCMNYWQKILCNY